MINDHKPYYLKQFLRFLERKYTQHFLAPNLEYLGDNPLVMKPWNMRIHGSRIRLGNNIHIVTTPDRYVSLSTWNFSEHQGHINVGDNVLICPGVRLDSASEIRVEDNCMFAAGSYVTDADWHDIYDRTRPVGMTRPVHLSENVWVGDGAIICKGVSVGENSVIGAGSVVASDIPPNVIAAGNPARVVRELDPDRALVTRASIFADHARLDREIERIERHLLQHNTMPGWLRSVFFPKRGD